MKSIALFCVFTVFFCSSYAQVRPEWLRYPSISPDGKTVAFTFHGDIYLVPSTGGKALPLVIHESHDFMPVWSRDGKNIAFASNRFGNFDVFVTSASGGEAKRLTWYSVDEFPYDFTSRKIVFGSARMDAVNNRQFPSEALQELYSVPAEGGRIEQLLTTPAEDAKISNDGKTIIYHDRKGRENPWRKHQVSSVARDIWMYDMSSGKHLQLSSHKGEDRSPVFSADQQTIYYLSERPGSFNIYEMKRGDTSSKQITFFKDHPVRFLSIADNGTLCFGYDGQLYIKQKEGQPKKINVNITSSIKKNNELDIPVDKIDELALSPSGNELAFIFRGEVFAADIKGNVIRQITHTPEAESSVSFSPDGSALLYASERDKKWMIIETRRLRNEDSVFSSAAPIKETVMISNGAENYQPKYSPDGKAVAYIADRVNLLVYDIASKRSRTLLNDMQLYSRRDNDQYFEWSPDSKWLLVQFTEPGGANDEVGIIAADGKEKLINLTKSGYTDSKPKWMMNGKMITWQSDRYGLHSYANSSTRQNDILAYKLDSNSSWTTIHDKKKRLSIYPSLMSDAIVSRDGKFLYYLSKAEQNYDLWVTNLDTKETKVLLQLNVDDATMQWDHQQKNIFLLSNGKIILIDPASAKKENISIQTSLSIDAARERESMFEHVWRRTDETFYTAGKHGADWNSLKKSYSKYLNGIDNNFDFAEMLNELLGELNVSHTGATFDNKMKNADATASLGVFYDLSYKGKGMKVEEVLEGSPLAQSSLNIDKETVIESVDGNTINETNNIEEFLNGKAGKEIQLQLREGNVLWTVSVKPISLNEETDLVLKRWVKRNEQETERLSNGQLGYVHLYRMNDRAYRDTYESVLGKFHNKKGLVVDTRFNRGGDLAPELAMFLSGIAMRQNTSDKFLVGTEPSFRWTKPSILLANEANYSDGHCFAYDFQNLQMGKLVGMPVPGSCTWMTGETLQDNSMHYSVPVLGVKTPDGRYMENYQTEPDILIMNDYGSVGKGTDLQLEKAVQELLSDLNKKK